MDQGKIKIVVLCGPTGIGKTSAAINLAIRFKGEIIGADSMQIYRHMDIGTAKPTLAEQGQVPHHLIDVIDPDKDFDAERYVALTRPLVAGVTGRDRVPLVVGGTGFYIKALIYGLFEAAPVKPDVRQRLHKEVADKGSPVLHKRLVQCDPGAAARIHPNDTYRVLRALEVFESSGQTISAWQKPHAFKNKVYDTLQIGLNMPRQDLYARIDQRVDQMIAQGLLDEVQGLLQKGYAPDLKAMQSLGYRHMIAYLQDQQTWDETVRTLKRDTRRYAKRQLTWFQADKDIAWIERDDIEKMADLIEVFLSSESNKSVKIRSTKSENRKNNQT
jgi:tRNA dimethylallyltransferase